MGNKVSARDVAKYVGVSIATVSNVINNINRKVSEETRQKVLKAIDELGFQPDFTARSLAKRKSNLLGIMLPITEAGDSKSLLLRDNPFYAEFLSGIEYEAGKRGYDVLITGIRPEQSLKDWVGKRNIDGVIFLGIYPEAFSNELKMLKVPVILLDTHRQDADFHSIFSDDFSAGEMACRYLLGLGHTKIAFASGNIEQSTVNKCRFEGYSKALEEAGSPVDRTRIFEDSASFEGGYRIGLNILEKLADITAVFCAADIIAFGVIKALRENGAEVPGQVSVMGFDNLMTCDLMFPGLTTLDQGIFEKGSTAASLLINDIEGIDHEVKNIVLPVRIIERDTVRRI